MVASGPSFKVFSLSLLPVLKIPKHEANDVKKNDEPPLSFLVLLISLLCEYDRSLFINRNDNFKKNMRALSLCKWNSKVPYICPPPWEINLYNTNFLWEQVKLCLHWPWLTSAVRRLKQLNSSVMKILRAIIFISLVIWLEKSSNHVINS